MAQTDDDKLVERNRRYLDGHAGKNDLKVGPLMLVHALEESTDRIEALKQHAPDALLEELEAVRADIGWNKGDPYSHRIYVISSDLRDRILAALRGERP